MFTWYEHTPEGIRLHIRVIPNAAKNEMVGVLNGRVKIKLHSPPMDGRANTELLNFLAEVLHIPKSRLMITKGKRGREKTVLVHGITERDIQTHLHHLS